jgi:O-antigen/teichoic acid export membrane protein
MSRIERLSSRGRVILSASSQTVGNLAVALILVGILRITTHTLGPANYGLFALVITFVNLISLVADLGIGSMTTRNLSVQGADRPLVLSVTLSSRVVLSILAIPIINGIAAVLYPHESSLFRISLAVMSLDVLFSTLQATAGAAFAARVRGDLIALMSTSVRVLYLVGVVLVAVLHGSYLGYVCAYVGADFVIAVAAFVGSQRSIPVRWNSDLRAWWRALAGAFPIGVIQFIDNIYSWIDSVLVAALRSSVQLGYYSIAFNVVNVLLVVPGFLMQALIPTMVNIDPEEIDPLLNRAVYVLFCIGAPLAAGGIVLRRDIILAIAGQRFLPATTPLALLLLILPLSFVRMALAFTSFAIDRYRPLLVVSIGVLAANVGINLLVIPLYGPIGAASALLGTEVASLVATYFVFRHVSGIRVRWISLWRPAIASGAVLSLAAARGSLWAHQNRILALLIGGSLVVVVYTVALVVVGGLPEELGKFLPGHHHREKTRPAHGRRKR